MDPFVCSSRVKSEETRTLYFCPTTPAAEGFSQIAAASALFVFPRLVSYATNLRNNACQVKLIHDIGTGCVAQQSVADFACGI